MWTHICVCTFLFTDLCQLMRQVIVCIYGWCVWNTALDMNRKNKKKTQKKHSNNDNKKQSLGYGKVERGMGRKGMSPIMERKVDS